MDTTEIEKEDDINAFIHLDHEDKSAKNTAKKGRLQDITLGIKSNISVDSLPVTAASKTLEDHVGTYDATVIRKIKSQAGSIAGMLNMDEFACGSSGETSFFGPTKNPADKKRIPGGSSSGSAAAVAHGLVNAALGTDTGGSIRNPSSHCGVVGYKPTYGLVSRYGLLDLAMSLDQIGPVAKDVETAALLLEVISGHDPRDMTSLKLNEGFYRFSENLDPDLSGKRIGYAEEFDSLIQDDEIKKRVHSSLNTLSDEGAEIIDVSLPNLELALPTYYLNVYVEFFSATRKYDGRRYGNKIEEVCGEEVLRRILLGQYISQKEYSGRYYRQALKARSILRKELSNALKEVDVLVSPTVPKLPHKLGTTIDDPMTMYAYDVFTVLANLAGAPSGSVPAGQVDSIPVGIQFMGRPLDDQMVLNVMHGFEKTAY